MLCSVTTTDMSKNIQIQTADDSHCEALTRVEIQSKLRSIPDCLEDYEVDFPSRLARWQSYFLKQSPLTSKPERIILKAVDGEEIIGYLAGHLTTRFGMDAEIQSFYILHEYQRQGIGTALLCRFSDWLKTHQGVSLCVGVLPANPYKAFYLKNGGKYLNEHWIIWNDVSVILSASGLPQAGPA